MARPPKVALLIETASSYGRGLLRGIARYARLHGPWSFFLEPGGQPEAPPPLRDWGVDGVITLFRTRRQARRMLAARIPVVDLDFTLPGLVPWGVCNDEAGVARTAAEHLLSRGLRSFAFVGWADVEDGISLWESQRQEEFVEAVSRAGHATSVYKWPARPADRAWGREQATLARWLKTLPKPAGVMASNDQRARHVLEAARVAAIAVPDQLAVIGVDNDEETCRLSDPPLSSVVDDPVRIGYEAARLLDGLIRKRLPRGPRAPLLIPPLGVETRRSTDVTAVEDRKVAQAMRTIRQRAGEGLKVEDLIREAHVSRSVLYRRFREALGRTPHEEILRVKLDRVKSLLVRTKLTVEEIAALAGFDHSEYLSVAFKREIGLTPGEYRRKSQPR